MTTQYPTGLDNFARPITDDPMSTGVTKSTTVIDNAFDAIEAIQTELGTLPKGSAASVKARIVALETGETLNTTSASGAALSLNVATYASAKVTLTAACTLTLTGAVTGQTASITLFLIQGGSGSYTVSWPAGIKWAAATAPVLSTAVGKIDVVTLVSYDAGSTWLGFLGGLAFA